MTMADIVSVSLLIRATLLLIAAIFLFVGGFLAYYEVFFMKKNGLTMAMGNVLHSIGLVLLSNSAMAFYASLASLQTITFSVMTWIGNGVIVLLLYVCYRVVIQLMTPEEATDE